MSDKAKSIVVLNPVSGIGKSAGRKEEILKVLREKNLKVEVVETTKKISAAIIARAAIKKGIRHVVVGGGDGTVMEVVSEAINKNIAVGIIPLGTGNIFAKNLNIPIDISDSIEIAFGKNELKMDVGKINDNFFAVNAGIGIDADVMNETSRQLKDKIGILAYIIVGIKKLGSRREKYSISIDGRSEKIYKAKGVMFANMERTAGGIKAVPGARPTNGKLSMGIIKARNLIDWIDILFNAVLGKVHKSPHYVLFTGRHFEIEALRKPRVFQCDGNTFTPVRKFTIDILPESLQVKIPK